MKTFLFRLGALRAEVEAETLPEAKEILSSYVEKASALTPGRFWVFHLLPLLIYNEVQVAEIDDDASWAEKAPLT